MTSVVLTPDGFPMGIVANHLAGFDLRFRLLTEDKVVAIINEAVELSSIIHNPLFARIVRNILEPHGIEIPRGKKIDKIDFQDHVLLMVYYEGPPISEDAIGLPEGGIFQWWLAQLVTG